MKCSVRFGDKDSYKDYGLVATSKLVVNPPSPIFEFLEVPGKNGQIDMSDVLTGEIIYSNRVGDFDFVVTKGNFEETYLRVLNELHARKMMIVLSEDPTFYYEGRISINNVKTDKNYNYISISYNLQPFKFYFSEEGLLEESISVVATGIDKTVVIKGESKNVIVPNIDVIEIGEIGFGVRFDGVSFSLSKGINRFVDIRLQGSNATLVFYGKGRATIRYRRGII